MASDLGDMVVRMVGDNTQFDSTVDKSEAKFKTLAATIVQSAINVKQSLKNIDGEMAVWGRSTDLIAQKQQVLKDEIKKLIAAGVDPLDDKIEKLQNEYFELGKESERLAKSQVTLQQKMNAVGNTMKNVGRNMTLFVTAPIIAAGVAIGKTAGDFEKSMNKVKALTGATSDEFKKLSDQARELGATTQYTASQAADAMGFMAQAGFNTAKIYQSLPSVLSLAAASQIDLATSADIVTNIMSGFNLTSDELSGTVDILTKQFISSNTDLSQLGQAFKYVGPVAKSFGVSIEETSAAIGFLSNAGIQGSAAGTGLRRVISVLSQEADKLGISTLTAAGNLRPLNEIISDLDASGLTAAKSLEIFGDRGGPAMQVLLSAGSDALKEMVTKLSDVDGLAKKIADTQMEGFNGQVLKMKSAAQEAGIALGTIMLPVMIKIAESITKTFNALAKLNPETQKLILTMALTVAAIGPLLIGMGNLLIVLPKLKWAFAALSANSVILAMIAIGAAISVIAIGAKQAAAEAKNMKDALQGVADLKNTELARDQQIIALAKARNALDIASKDVRLKGDKETLANLQKIINQEASKLKMINDNYLGQLRNIKTQEDEAKKERELIALELEKVTKKQEAAAAAASGSSESAAAAQAEIDALNEQLDLLDEMERLRREEIELLVSNAEESVRIRNEQASEEYQIWSIQDAFRKKLSNDELTRSEKEKKKKIEDAKQIKDTLVSLALATAQSLSTIMANNTSAEIDSLRSTYAVKTKEELAYQAFQDKQSAANYASMSAEEKKAVDLKKAADASRAKSEKELAQKVYQLELKAFKTNRTFALAQIAINTAAAVAKVWGQTGIAGLIAQAAPIAMGILQAAVVKSQKPPVAPSFEKGGIVLPQPGGMLANVADGNVPEVIFPLDKLEQFLSKGSVDNSGSGFQEGNIYLTVQLDTGPIFKKIFPATKNRQILISSGAVV